jgi:hypothetical protein
VSRLAQVKAMNQPLKPKHPNPGVLKATAPERVVVALLAIILSASCASRPVNPADSLTMLGVNETRTNQQIAKMDNLPFKDRPAQWLVLRPGLKAYVETRSYACATAKLRVSIAKLPEIPPNGYSGCWQIARTTSVVTGAIAHIAESDYVVQARSDSGQRFYVGGDDVKPIIPTGTPLTIATTRPDCGSWDNDDPCDKAALVNASGAVICTLDGGEDAQLLDFRPDFQYFRIHVQIKDGRACPGYTGYMSELDVNEDSVFGFEDVQGAK